MVIISVTFTDERVVIMPGFVTHYIFGIEAYHNLKSNTKKKLIRSKKLFQPTEVSSLLDYRDLTFSFIICPPIYSRDTILERSPTPPEPGSSLRVS